MAGHNKWSSIKHRKGAQDKKRSKIFTKIIKEITVAVKLGGSDVSSNPRLRSAIAAAHAANMPKDNIKRAIAKGEGGQKGEEWVELVYEGYGPHQVAVIVECLTDNKNRTISAVRGVFNKNNGNIGSSNSVLFMFDRLGVIEVPKDLMDEDSITEHALEAGADDVITDQDETYEILCDPSSHSDVLSYFEGQEIKISKSAIELRPQNTIEIGDADKAVQVIKFIDALEDEDDVQNVYSNFDISDDVLAQLDA